MNTIRIPKKLRASAIGAAAVVSALLFSGAGIVQAGADPECFIGNDNLAVMYSGGGPSLFAIAGAG